MNGGHVIVEKFWAAPQSVLLLLHTWLPLGGGVRKTGSSSPVLGAVTPQVRRHLCWKAGRGAILPSIVDWLCETEGLCGPSNGPLVLHLRPRPSLLPSCLIRGIPDCNLGCHLLGRPAATLWRKPVVNPGRVLGPCLGASVPTVLCSHCIQYFGGELSLMKSPGCGGSRSGISPWL